MASDQEDSRPLLQYNGVSFNHTPEEANTTKATDSSSSTLYRVRKFLRWFLTSKYGHYLVIVLVSLDVCGIFASFLITLHTCEHPRDDERLALNSIKVALDALSLVFSCLFMFELLCSVYAFGLQYFTSKFHIFDALTILASFLVDVLTHGPTEEAGSLVIVLRLFRVFKIIEESSTVAEESMNQLQEKVSKLEKENDTLRQRITGSASTTVDV